MNLTRRNFVKLGSAACGAVALESQFSSLAAQMGKGSGMMGGAPIMQDLKAVGSDKQIAAIRYCDNTYHVTMADGKTLSFWEFNLRFKTDASNKGPLKGRPALLHVGMKGDRAFAIFAAPSEMSAFIESTC